MNDNYNDGVCYFYEKRKNLNSFNAPRNVKNKEELIFIDKYFFKEESQRQQDVAFASAIDKKLSLKISVPYTNIIQSEYVAIINNYLYSIFHVDPDRINMKTYIYLEGMREIERQDK